MGGSGFPEGTPCVGTPSLTRRPLEILPLGETCGGGEAEKAEGLPSCPDPSTHSTDIDRVSILGHA